MKEQKTQLVPDLPKKKKVECLGKVFENDLERKKYFAGKLWDALGESKESLEGAPYESTEKTVKALSSLTKWSVMNPHDTAQRMGKGDRNKDLLQLWKDEVGFPHGEFKDIVRLSDPPFYTACPNPFIQQFIDSFGTPYCPEEEYRKEPFAADVSEGKNDPIYNAHSYHTKVPHKAIMRYILHYTKPGDLVYDGFCGTGMTGVAAQMCGDRETVESLGYKVDRDGTILELGEDGWKKFSELGPRRAILNDLSPAATFIAYNYNTPSDALEFEQEAKRILDETEKECDWMYATLHTHHPNLSDQVAEEISEQIGGAKSIDEIKKIIKDNGKYMGKINYTVWSDVFLCPNCTKEMVFWDIAVDRDTQKIKDTLQCPHCGIGGLKKRNLERAWETVYDKAINQTIRQAKQVPVLINYTANKKRYEKIPDKFDDLLLQAISGKDIPYWFPTTAIPKGDKTGEPLRLGITHAHHFYTKRNLWMLSLLYQLVSCDGYIVFQSICTTLSSRLVRYNFRKRGNGPLPGTLYVASFQAENNLHEQYYTKTLSFVNGLAGIERVNSLWVEKTKPRNLWFLLLDQRVCVIQSPE